MADRIYESRHKLTYITTDARTGVTHRLVLCDTDSLLSSPVTEEGSVVVQRDNIIDSPWIRQRSQGNASLALSVSVIRVFADVIEAEQYGDDMHLWMITHSEGKLLVEAYPDYDSLLPTRTRYWTATLDGATPSPITQDKFFGVVRDRIADMDKYAWREMAYKFTLSDPYPSIINPPLS